MDQYPRRSRSHPPDPDDKHLEEHPDDILSGLSQEIPDQALGNHPGIHLICLQHRIDQDRHQDQPRRYAPHRPHGDAEHDPVHKCFYMLHQCRVPELFKRRIRYQEQIGTFQLRFPFSRDSRKYQCHVSRHSQQKKLGNLCPPNVLPEGERHDRGGYQVDDSSLGKNKPPFLFVFQKLPVKDRLRSACPVIPRDPAELPFLLPDAGDHLTAVLLPLHLRVIIRKFRRVFIIGSFAAHMLCRQKRGCHRTGIQGRTDHIQVRGACQDQPVSRNIPAYYGDHLQSRPVKEGGNRRQAEALPAEIQNKKQSHCSEKDFDPQTQSFHEPFRQRFICIHEYHHADFQQKLQDAPHNEEQRHSPGLHTEYGHPGQHEQQTDDH